MQGTHIVPAAKDTAVGPEAPQVRSEHTAATRVQVWDLPIRIFHWALIVALAAAWYTARGDAMLHAWAGYSVAGLIVFRIWWGLAGSRFARFDGANASPRAVVTFIREVATFQAPRYLGRDPIGGLFLLAVVVLLGAVCATGFAMTTLSIGGEPWVRTLHGWAFAILLVLIPFHILAVIISSWVHDDNLIGSMLTGWKRLDDYFDLPAAIRTPELRLADRMRAIEALAVMTLLSGLALGLGLYVRQHDAALLAAAKATAVSAVAAAPPPTPAPTPAPVIQPTIDPSRFEEERARLKSEIDTVRTNALRDVAEARRVLDAQLTAAREQATAELSQKLKEAREQAVAEMKQAAAQVPARVTPEIVAAERRSASEVRPDEAVGTLTGMVSAGGRLYDNWLTALGKPAPQAAHPSWPAGREAATAGDTWRCASCHGFDYRGDPGSARLQGAGLPFASVRRAEKMSVERIVALLGDDVHRFGDDRLPPNAKLQLAMFLSKGQYTAARYFASDGRAKGSPARGRERFLQACASCHGVDGKLAVRKDGAPLGAIAVGSPAEMFHKIRNGHPGAMSAAQRPTPLSLQTDLLAYVQTLPRE